MIRAWVRGPHCRERCFSFIIISVACFLFLPSERYSSTPGLFGPVLRPPNALLYCGDLNVRTTTSSSKTKITTTTTTTKATTTATTQQQKQQQQQQQSHYYGQQAPSLEWNLDPTPRPIRGVDTVAEWVGGSYSSDDERLGQEETGCVKKCNPFAIIRLRFCRRLVHLLPGL